MKIFGFDIKREGDEEVFVPASFAEPQNDDGAITVGNAMGGFYSTLLDMEGSAKTESGFVGHHRRRLLGILKEKRFISCFVLSIVGWQVSSIFN